MPYRFSYVQLKAWNPEAATYIQDFHMLRPILPSQIDGLSMDRSFRRTLVINDKNSL